MQLTTALSVLQNEVSRSPTLGFLDTAVVSRNPNVGLRRSHAIGPERPVIAEGYKFVM